jgi:hypothetical protein
MSTRVLTNITEIWNVPPEHQNEEYRIRTEVVIYFFDTSGTTPGENARGFVPGCLFDGSPIPLKAGQRVAIDGVIVPQRQQFVWDKTRIHILEENVGSKANRCPTWAKTPRN